MIYIYISIYIFKFVCLITYFKIQNITIHRKGQECAGTSHLYVHYFQTHTF